MSQTSIAPRIERVAKFWTPDARLLVPIKQDLVVFNFPVFGRGIYDNVVKRVLVNGQKLPTGEQDAFMLDVTYNHDAVKDSDEARFVRDNVMHSNWLWVPNVNVWTAKDVKNPGVYVVFDEDGKGLSVKRNLEELEDKLGRGSTERGVRFSKDRKVAFAPLSTIKSEEHSKGTLAQDGAFIANYGIEGAEKLDRVAERFALAPYSWIINNHTNEQVQTLSVLSRGRSIGYWLVALFDSNGNKGSGYVLSVSGS